MFEAISIPFTVAIKGVEAMIEWVWDARQIIDALEGVSNRNSNPRGMVSLDS